MDPFAYGIAGSYIAFAVLLMVLKPLVGMVIGVIAGKIAGWIIPKTFKAFGPEELSPWQVGALVGFFAGFFS